MRKIVYGLLSAVLFVLLTGHAAISSRQDVKPVLADVVIRGALIVDGTGQPGKVGDVAIKNDRIVAIGKFPIAGKPRILDARGLVLAPGFIDLHTHSDRSLQRRGTNVNLNYLTQGVTTAVTGNCGAGPVNVDAYYRKMESLGQGSNVIHQLPHNAIRRQVMGNANRPPSPKELAEMKRLVAKGMKDGAWGMSTGLIYNPGTYAKTDELIELAKVVKEHGGFYASHIRNESSAVLAALHEILLIAERAGIRVHISHIKVSGRNAWGLAPDMIALIREARRKKKLKVTADQYPYIASSTSLAAMVIPAKYREGSSKDLLARLDDPKVGPQMKKDIAAAIKARSGKSLRIASYRPNPKWQGKDLATIAKQEKMELLDLVLHIQRKGGAGMVHFGMNPEEVRLFMKEPWVATASDGGARLPDATKPHPRSYGCFPRKIGRYALEDKIISLEQAIRSASGLPADILELPQRGYIKKGYFADIVIFDPKTFRDKATFDEPHQYSTGVTHLFVNGSAVIAQGRYTGILPGRVLRHRGK